jgi:very-short-patch-repair endonuclease/preprotein translocase subunit Sec61beta
MEQSGVPIVTSLRIENLQEHSITDPRLVFTLSPNLGSLRELRLPRIRPGEVHHEDAVDVRLEPGRLRLVREAEQARFDWVLCDGTTELANGSSPIQVLAFNEWPGTRAPLGLLASFVTPNHPRVPELLRAVADRLAGLTGNRALDGYQSESTERVLAQLAALYDVLQSLQLTYVGLPASFEEIGQKVRLIDQVLDEAMGNCLDLTLLIAACLEQMGLAPVLLLVKGHAFVGVWVEPDRFPDGLVQDTSRVRTSLQLKKLVCFEATAITSSPPLGFAEAVRAAEQHLARDADFHCAIDVRVMRRELFRPLSFRDPETAPVAVPGEAGPAAVSAIAATLGIVTGEAPRTASEVAAPARTRLEDRLHRWREHLLDLSLRNRLLNFKTDAKSTLPLEIPNVALFEDLLAGEKVFTLEPKPSKEAADHREERLVQKRADPHLTKQQREADLERGVIHCPIEQQRMIPQAAEIDREARSALEEGGANTLFAAIGLLRWYESEESQVERLAPLVLVPVALEYSRMKREARLRRLPEDTLGNVTLVEKMRRDFGVDLSVLLNLDTDESGVDIQRTLKVVREAIQRVPRWEVRDEAHLGLFSFSKFLLWADLKQNAEHLLANPLVRHIAEASGKSYVAGSPPVAPERLDAEIPPDALPIVLDADSTQTAAIVAALRGRTFVLQGPPGTGKSQTITNIIAAAIAANKSVLFVSEKMAALEVVHRRLEQVGLGDFCLELHSHKSNRKEAIESLGRSLKNRIKTPEANWASNSASLAGLRQQLNEYPAKLHQTRPIGFSFYRANARLLALRGLPELQFRLSDLVSLDQTHYAKLLELVEAFGTCAEHLGSPRECGWLGTSPQSWSGELEAHVRSALQTGIGHQEIIRTVGAKLGEALGLAPPLTLEHAENLAYLGQTVGIGPAPLAAWDELAWNDLRGRAHVWIERSAAVEHLRADLMTRWRDGVFTLNLEYLSAQFAKWSTAFFPIAWLMLLPLRRLLKRQAVGRLPAPSQTARDLDYARGLLESEAEVARLRSSVEPQVFPITGALSRDALTALVARVEQLRGAAFRAGGDVSKLGRVAQLASPATPQDWRAWVASEAARLAMSVAGLRDCVGRLTDMLRPAAPLSRLSIEELRVQLARWLQAERHLRGWCRYQQSANELSHAGLGALPEALDAGRIGPAQVRVAAENSILSAWVRAVRDREPTLRDFDGPNHHRIVRKFREQDREHLQLARHRVLAAAIRNVPVANDNVADTSEPGILRRESAKKRGHMAIRKLLTQIPNLLPRLKPCFLMSPLSVAQFLPADGRRFDLVVFDEASQICTHDAIGALARGNQAIIVGDSRQLPPTSFFQRTSGDPDDADETQADQESILDEALAAGVEEQWLTWHYRSRHESLIAFSNQKYYEGRLHIFPAARGKVADLGVHWHPVPHGWFDVGATRTNREEAVALVTHLVSTLLRTTPGERTFGVVTLNIQQQRLVLDLLDEARGTHPELEGHFADNLGESVFVKNLENVQGDERDEIYISIGYGRDKQGREVMNFGPLNRKGGERRLNVAVTRARQTLRVFSTLTADMIDTTRTKSQGAAHLKAFLRHAAERGGTGAQGQSNLCEFDSDFERDVFEALAASGHRVESQVGCGGYRIDLAILHPKYPGTYALGIECDGAAYHSAATARDRDRLRQSVLEGLGWRLHRIWSTDWFLDRERELVRLEKAIEEALREPEIPKPAPAAPVNTAEATQTDQGEPEQPLATNEPSPPVAPQTPSRTQPYVQANVRVISSDPEDIHNAGYARDLLDCIATVLSVEAPIHTDELARRVGGAFSVQRTTDRLRTRVLTQLRALSDSHVVRGDFVWPANVAPHEYRVVRTGDRDLAFVPLEELAAASLVVLESNLSVPTEQLFREVARLFGVSRLGQKVQARLADAVQQAAAWGCCRIAAERVEFVTFAKHPTTQGPDGRTAS